MKNLVLIALVAGFAGQAQASDQLARSLGVEPGQYTTAQLVQLRAAVEDHDQTQIRAILGNDAKARASSKRVGTGGGHAQLAASQGVATGDYSTAQLIQMQQAAQDDGHSGRVVYRNRATVANLSTTDVSTAPGHVQMAHSLGVDPSRYSTAKLVAMRADKWSDDSEE